MKLYMSVALYFLQKNMVFSWDKDVPSDEAEIIMNRIAKKVIDYGLEVPVILALEMATPWAFPGGEIMKMTFFPYLGLIGEESYKVINTLNKQGNTQKLVEKIRELSEKNL